jgi:hypothetical protein
MFSRPSAAVIPNEAAVQHPARTKSLRDIPFFRDMLTLSAATAENLGIGAEPDIAMTR